jgi:hypothetical protein
MGTSSKRENPSDKPKKWKATGEDRARANLAKDEFATGLMGLYGVSVHKEITVPLLGYQRFELLVYDEVYQRTPKLTVPSLDYLSQHLGFSEHAGVEAISQLKIADGWKSRLFADAFGRGKGQLKGYLRRIRPLLIKRGIYLYCLSPFIPLKREIVNGLFRPDRLGQRMMPLSALPSTVDEAVLWKCSDEQIGEELAPQVSWLIPMLVLYRRVKLDEELKATFDGWLSCLNRQQKEQMHTNIVHYAPHLVTDEITGLLLPGWLKDGKSREIKQVKEEKMRGKDEEEKTDKENEGDGKERTDMESP